MNPRHKDINMSPPLIYIMPFYIDQWSPLA